MIEWSNQSGRHRYSGRSSLYKKSNSSARVVDGLLALIMQQIKPYNKVEFTLKVQSEWDSDSDKISKFALNFLAVVS